MEKITRILQKQVEERLFTGKVVIIHGARQVGKTTLVKDIIAKYPDESLYLNCELLSVSQALSKPEAIILKKQFDGKRLVVLDEAQKIENIGLILKILVDTYPEIQIIATGSSSFELANKTQEPLTGRAYRFNLYPVSATEIIGTVGAIEFGANLDDILRFGLYPDVYGLGMKDSINRLDEISSNYLYKDILMLDGLNKSEILLNLLQFIALQLGSEVSYDELAKSVGVSRITIKKYIDLLEKTFVIFRLRAFSRNPRKEIS